ncbi:MAG: hypothetical protein JEZ08_14980 [Clostridiales bacterium]|nr:hypothetical protein [Clostridiales bacterium]
MKKMIVFLVFIAFCFGVYFITSEDEVSLPSFHYMDDFDTLDRDFWYVGEWKSLYSAYDKAKLNNSILKLEIDEVDKGPVLLSKPIEIMNGNVLTIKRRVRMTYANNHFTGGLALIETKDEGLIPSALNNDNTNLGNGIVLVEYVNSFEDDSKRPGRNVFRILPRSWEFDDNFELVEPIFNEWFEEEIIYDTTEKTITYKLNDKEYLVKSQEMFEERIRIYMHGYGFETGHIVEIDWIEISID